MVELSTLLTKKEIFMTFKKILLGLTLTLISSVLTIAQTVSWHGYMDYSNYPLTTYATQDDGEDWSQYHYGAGYGSWYGGRTDLNLHIDSEDFRGVVGLRLAQDLTSWYGLYTGQESEVTDWFQGNIAIDFMGDQVTLYTGLYDGLTLGYNTAGYAWGQSYTHSLATWGDKIGRYYTGVEFKPFIFNGFSILAGLPIEAWSVNDGWSNMPTDNYWPSLIQQFKVNVRYSLPIGVTLKGTYYNALDYATDSDLIDEDVTREAGISAEAPNFLFSGIDFNLGYNWQFNTATEGMKHNVMVSLASRPLPELWFGIDNRFAYAEEFHEGIDEIFMDKVLVNMTYDTLMPGVQLGLRGNFSYMSDSTGQQGTAVSGDDDDLGFNTLVDASFANSVTDGTSGEVMSWGVNPTIKKNFQHGYVSLGYQMQMISVTSETTNSAITHMIPLNIAFWF